MKRVTGRKRVTSSSFIPGNWWRQSVIVTLSATLNYYYTYLAILPINNHRSLPDHLRGMWWYTLHGCYGRCAWCQLLCARLLWRTISYWGAGGELGSVLYSEIGDIGILAGHNRLSEMLKFHVQLWGSDPGLSLVVSLQRHCIGHASLCFMSFLVCRFAFLCT